MGGPVSEKADVYSFGVVLLELVTGKNILSEMGKLLRWVRYSETVLVVFPTEDIFVLNHVI